jgi:hypothetical protein
MTHKRRLVCGAIAILAAAVPLHSASATCPNALASGAVWHLHIMEVSPSPDGANVIKCVMTFGSGGNFTAPCTNFNTGSTAAQSVNISGKITLTAACDFTGTITIPSDAKAFVKFGHINGNIGSGIGIQGTGANTQVLHLTLVKK